MQCMKYDECCWLTNHEEGKGSMCNEKDTHTSIYVPKTMNLI